MLPANLHLRDIGTALLDLVLPRCCVVCGRQLQLQEHYICTTCLSDLPRTFYWKVARNPMADRFNSLVQSDLSSNSCEPYSYACALFFYNAESPYRHITPHLKYGRGINSGRFFSRQLASRLATAPQFVDVDWIVPVPLHWMRRLHRGYNQAEIIASEIADVMGAQLRSDVLVRCRRTQTQVRLNVQQKVRNVEGAFKARGDRLMSGEKPHHILLVDDVFTTGATMNACRKALRSCLDADVRISVVSLAFVVE